MLPDICGSSLLLALPDDIFSVITSSLSLRDVCNLGLSCPGLDAVLSSDKVWLSQCNKLGLLPFSTLIEWRKGVLSYKALCRFLVNIQPLIGIWVHKNPELGNVVYVMPGFLSVIGCRIIPQEIGPLGLEDSPILWAPVFEIICKYDCSKAFFLHGREQGADYVYPGLLKSFDRDCNVLLLEVEHRLQRDEGKLADIKKFADEAEKEKSKSQRIVGQKWTENPFIRLESDDQSRLLDFVTSQVRDFVPEAANVLLFPRSRNDEVDSKQDFAALHERRLLLLELYEHGNVNHDIKSDEESPSNPTELGSSDDVSESLDSTSAHQGQSSKGKKTLSAFLKNGLKKLLRKSSSTNSDREYQEAASPSYQITLDEFLESGDWVGLSVQAATMQLRCYKAWPIMQESISALYKLPVQTPEACDEYAGLWAGNSGWPPSTGKPGGRLCFIFVSYEESEGQRQMIANKILQGSMYPNGSAMFVVNTDQPSTDIFPWDTDEESNLIDVKQSFKGEGISDGYGFRYPGSKPGSLFVLENGMLVFIWKESRDVLTLKRLNLADLLKRGERVPSLPPISNFAYLTREYRNVYSGFSDY
ncbi:hypothetical protein MIMGU_mgv1a023521mg [Erythranthe guttata]|uniref:F-box domain-containing protein n=2 Tax=Erythranthe guttata TaxID=4155 RepID=A0A022QBA9_ERYGU|nr:hypothetical protein MIMGU_mgv1a023521mg [Erythranthe guttata]